MGQALSLIPKLEVSWEDIEKAVANIGGEQIEPPDVGYLLSWKVDDASVHLVEDEVLHARGFLVEGDDREAVAGKLRDALPIYKPSEMPALLDEARNEDDFTMRIGVVAAVAPETADPDVVKAFRQAYAHPEPLVREQAALVSTSPRWPELRPDLERLAREDEDEDVRESASVALSDFDKPKPSDAPRPA